MYRTILSTVCDIYATNLKVKVQDQNGLRYIHYCLAAYSLCAMWSLSYLDYLLITFVICARWTGDIYSPHIKLSDCPYVRISSIAKQLMSFPLFRI